MLSQYFGFKEEPFGISPDPRCLFLSQTHRQALEALEEGFLSNRGFTAMIAPPGMGKTTLLFRFLEDVRESARVVFLFDLDATCEPREFVAYVLRDLGITPAQGSAEMHEQLSEALIKENMAGRKFVIVIDEAQNLSEAVLERVRLLTNFENSRGKLIQVVLSGQPQLSDKLLQSSLIQLRQRISTVCHIEPLSAGEIAGYIDYRVKMAGHPGQPLFADDAIKLIAEASQGTPRVINNLCYNALSLCAKLKMTQVDAAMVAKVITSLQLVPQSNARAAAAAPVAAGVDEVVEQPRKRREFGGLRLAPESDDAVPAERKRPATEPSGPRFWERTRLRLVSFAAATAGSVMLWVPAGALILVFGFVGVLRLTEVLSPPSHSTGADQTTDMSVPPPSDSDDPGATESTAPADPGNPVSARAGAPRPMQAAAIPKPSPMNVSPSASVPMQSASPAPSSGSDQKPLEGNATLPMPSAAAQPVVRPSQANDQPPATSATPAPPQQTSAAPVASAPKQVHAALAGGAPQPVAPSTAEPSVRPALPQH